MLWCAVHVIRAYVDWIRHTFDITRVVSNTGKPGSLGIVYVSLVKPWITFKNQMFLHLPWLSQRWNPHVSKYFGIKESKSKGRDLFLKSVIPYFRSLLGQVSFFMKEIIWFNCFWYRSYVFPSAQTDFVL